MLQQALGDGPTQWIVNSNALGVIFLSRANDFRISFLSRHAVARLSDGSLLGKTAAELIGSPARALAGIPELSTVELADPERYPTTVRTAVGDRCIELAISPVLSSSLEYLGAMATFQDVTSQVALEEESLRFKERIRCHAAEAGERASQTELVAGSLNETVAAVRGQTSEVGRLVARLTNLNKQTHMLALNASIEAARAGHAGKPFRVIADEVGQLAGLTRDVAEEVETILSTIDTGSAEAFSQVDNLIDNVATLVASQRSLEREVDQH